MAINDKQLVNPNVKKAFDDIYASLLKVNEQLKTMSTYGSKISGAKNINELKTATTQLNTEQKKYTDTVNQTIKLETDLKNASTKQKDAELLLAKAKEEKRRKSKEVTEQAKKEIAEQNKEIGTLQKLTNRNKELNEQKKKLDLTTKQGRKNLQAINTEQDKNNKLMNKAANAAQKQTKGIGGYFKAIVKGGLAFAGVNVGVQLLKKGLDTMINSVQSTGDKFAIFAGGLKEGMNGVFRSIATGETSFKELIQNFKDARKAGEEYAKTLDDIGDRVRMQSILEAEQTHNLTELEKIAKDVSKTNAERTKSAKEFIAIQEKLNKGRVENAKLAFDAEFKIAEQRSGMSEKEIIDYLKNYGIISKAQNELTILREKEINIASNLRRAREDGIPFMIDSYETELNYVQEAIKRNEDLTSKYEGQNEIVDEGIGGREALTKTYIDLLTVQESVFKDNKRMFATLFTIQDEENLKAIAIKKSKISEQKKFNEDILKLEEEMFAEGESLNQENLDEIDKQNQEAYAKEAQRILDQIELEKKLGELKKETAYAAFDLANELFDRKQEMTARGYDDDIALAKKNGKDTEKLEQEKAIAVAKIQRKQAILNKSIALSEIAINTAVGAMKVTGQTGVGAIFAVPLVIASGVLQASTVLAQPLPEIPSFYKGVKNFEGGIAVVGDSATGGSQTELIKLPNNDKFLVNEPTMINLPKGSDVIPNDNIQSELASLAMRGREVSDINTIRKKDFDELGNKIIKGISNTPQTIYKGVTIAEVRQRNERKIYLNKKYG